MNCKNTSEVLPWLVNGSLADAERRAVEVHLRECESCRRELEETLAAGAIYAAHPEARALVAYAAGDAGESAELLERHLAGCPECAAELTLIRESRKRIEGKGGTDAEAAGDTDVGGRESARGEDGEGAQVLAGPWRQAAPWRRLAMAAGLAGIVAAAGWTWTGLDRSSLRGEIVEQQAASQRQIEDLRARIERLRSAAGQDPRDSSSGAGPTDAEELRRRAEEAEVALRRLEAEQRDARERVAALEGRLADVTAPRLAPQVRDLFPQEGVVRGSDSSEAPERLRQGQGPVALILNLPRELDHPRYVARITDAEGTERTAEVSLAAETGSVTLILYPGSLPPGPVKVTLLGEGPGEPVEVATYSFQVVS